MFTECSTNLLSLSDGDIWDFSEEGKYLEGEERIAFLLDKVQEIRKIYMSLKVEVACIDRRRKRHRRKEKEGRQLRYAAQSKDFLLKNIIIRAVLISNDLIKFNAQFYIGIIVFNFSAYILHNDMHMCNKNS